MVKPFDNISEKNKHKLFQAFHTHILSYNKGEDLSKMLMDTNSLGIIWKYMRMKCLK